MSPVEVWSSPLYPKKGVNPQNPQRMESLPSGIVSLARKYAGVAIEKTWE